METINGVLAVGHNGFDLGTIGAFRFYPKKGYMIVGLSNSDSNIKQVFYKLQEMIARL
jgi:hypothetical protein